MITHMSATNPQPGTAAAGTRTTDVAGMPSPKRAASVRKETATSRRSV
jgi:hypothetical protein